mgnify:FL=1
MKNAALLIVGGLLLAANPTMMSDAAAASCTVGASGISFGSFSPLTHTVVDSTGSVTVNCTDVSFYSISLSSGNGSYAQRRMVSGGSSLFYNLYRDASCQQVWGDGNAGASTVTLANPASGQNYVHIVYGRIPLSVQRSVGVGLYGDVITVVVSY